MITSSSAPLDWGDGPSDPSRTFPPHANSSDSNQDALRIQVAAVMAQQVALTEKEAELIQRRIAFESQESQLAGHLEARHVKLNQLQDRLRLERQGIIEAKQAWKKEKKEQLLELANDRNAAREAERKADAERQRLLAMYRRLRKRWKQNFAIERNRLSQWGRDLLSQKEKQEADQQAIRGDKHNLAQSKLALTTSIELSKRESQEGWQALHLLQRQEQVNVAAWQQRQEASVKELADLKASLARERQALADQKGFWEQRKTGLEKECAGLENRVRNLRVRLAGEERVTELQLGSVKTASTYLPIPAREDLPSAKTLTPPRLHESFGDQRLVLAERAARLLSAWHGWLADRDSLEGELTARTTALLERERFLEVSSQAFDSLSQDLRHRETLLQRTEQHLEARQARLHLREIDLETEWTSILSSEQARADLRVKYRTRIVRFHRSWVDRRRQDLKRVLEIVNRCEEARDHYVAILDDTRQRSSTLECEARRLAEKALAVEEYRLETLSQAPDAAKAERRIQHLRRRWARLFAASEGRILGERQALANEAARLDALGKTLAERAEDLAYRETQLSGRQTKWEVEQARAQELGLKHQAEVQTLQAHLNVAERRRSQLADEVERLIQVLAPGERPAALSLWKAA